MSLPLLADERDFDWTGDDERGILAATFLRSDACALWDECDEYESVDDRFCDLLIEFVDGVGAENRSSTSVG